MTKEKPKRIWERTHSIQCKWIKADGTMCGIILRPGESTKAVMKDYKMMRVCTACYAEKQRVVANPANRIKSSR